MGIYEKLLNIQTELKVPKNLHNEFGHYDYRSCESILEAVKPLCLEQNCILLICDDIIVTGSENYIKATATLTDIESSEKIEVTAFAREATTKKGMDSSQITGSSSSYARKYALSGLFLIDDAKDADGMNNEDEQNNKPKTNATQSQPHTNTKLIGKMEIGKIMSLAEQKGASVANVTKAYHKQALSELTQVEYTNCIAQLSSKPDKVTANG